MTTYYVVETEYVGPNQSQHLNDHTYNITTDAPRTNLSREVRTEGWLGTTNDWSEIARGAYDSLDEARAAVRAALGDNCRESDAEDLDEGVVESYLVGAYEAWDAESSETWCYESRHEVTADTTDEQIAAIVESCEEWANSENNATLDTDAVEKMLTEYRDELREARDAENDGE